MQFTVSDQSVNANCPILGSPTHPNANAISKPLFTPGNNDYIGWSTLFPTGFPSICTPAVSGCFMQIMEIYGMPFAGSSPVSMMVSGRSLFLNTRVAGNIWTSPQIQYGAWNDFVLHVNFSTNPTLGYIELWYKGQPQTFKNGSTRFYEATLQPGVNWDGTHPDTLYLQQYRGANPPMGTLTLYHTGAKVGTTYASAAP
jgi:hypothetical protein